MSAAETPQARAYELIAAGGTRLDGKACPSCGAQELFLHERFTLNPLGSASLAGMQLKATARRTLHVTCVGCCASGDAAATGQRGDRTTFEVTGWTAGPAPEPTP